MDEHTIFDIKRFNIDQVSACGAVIKDICERCSTMEDAANKVVQYIYENFRNYESGSNSFPLVRFYVTHLCGTLPPDLSKFITTMMEDDKTVLVNANCLALLATAGDEKEWNSRRTSVNHKCVQLASIDMIYQFPMISQLLKQFKIDIKYLVEPNSEIILDTTKKTYNVFFVPEAVGSKYIPAQENFVIPYNISSVLGFGGFLNTGSLAVVILFSRDKISDNVADLFKLLSLDLDMAFAKFNTNLVFKESIL